MGKDDMSRLRSRNSQSMFTGLYQGQQILTESHKIIERGEDSVIQALEHQVKVWLLSSALQKTNKKFQSKQQGKSCVFRLWYNVCVHNMAEFRMILNKGTSQV